MNALSTKDPYCLGSRVEGMRQYSPGLSCTRIKISRRLLNSGRWKVSASLKKSFPKGVFLGWLIPVTCENFRCSIQKRQQSFTSDRENDTNLHLKLKVLSLHNDSL